jgi:hypothetical protein
MAIYGYPLITPISAKIELVYSFVTLRVLQAIAGFVTFSDFLMCARV